MTSPTLPIAVDPTTGPGRDPTAESWRLAELGSHAAELVHELRNLVGSMKALAQLTQAQPERSDMALPAILEQLQLMEDLIAGYHDFSRRPQEEGEVFDVRGPMRSAAMVLAHRARAAQVRLDVEDGAGVAVRGSRLAAMQALVNLGQNAIDAVWGRGDGRVSVRLEQRSRRVAVVVEDNGPGLPAEIRENLFERFRTTKPDGTGLGLALSRELIERSGGRLLLEEGGSGARWRIELPRVG
jgi:two-component system C4-dicarboxylate transport sensor histidine kinase DctB